MRSLPTAVKISPCSPQLEKSPCNSEDPTQPKINKYTHQYNLELLILYDRGSTLGNLGEMDRILKTRRDRKNSTLQKPLR